MSERKISGRKISAIIFSIGFEDSSLEFQRISEMLPNFTKFYEFQQIFEISAKWSQNFSKLVLKFYRNFLTFAEIHKILSP